jgi:hypothetical protein
MPVRFWLSLDEDGTQLTLRGDILDDGPVNPSLMLVQVDEYFVHHFSRTFAEDFMTPHCYQGGRIHADSHRVQWKDARSLIPSSVRPRLQRR